MEVYLAKHRGFCFGVRRSIAIAEETYQNYGKSHSLGPLIHNPQQVAALSDKLVPINSLDEAVLNTLIIRSHGASPQVISQAKQKGLQLVDATCPLVSKNQQLPFLLASEGCFIVIVGNPKHPEIEALIGWVNTPFIVVDHINQVLSLPPMPRIAVMSQTTENMVFFEQIIGVLQYKTSRLKICNTICPSSVERQQAAADLSQHVNLMLVIGGRNSANTGKLAQICRENGVITHQIETADDLNIDTIKNINRIGIAAGASTPDWIIEEVVVKMSEFENVVVNDGAEELKQNITEEPSTAEPATVVAETPVAKLEEQAEIADEAISVQAETPPAKSEEKPDGAKTEQASFSSEYETFDTIRTGARVKGIIVRIKEGELLVDIGGKSEGILPSSELIRKEADNINEFFKIGDEIEVLILRKENKEGYPMLSKKRIDQELCWEKIKAAKEEGVPVTGKVVEVVKGGLLADVGIRGFIPASMVSTAYVEDLNVFVGQEMSMRVEECDKHSNKLILSPKAVMKEQNQKRKAETLANLAAGQTVTGTVRRLTGFGAFIDIGGLDGLLHISEMAWYRVAKPSDLLKEGDQLDVYILSIDAEKEKISLGLKQLIPNPWSLVAEKYPPEAVVDAKVMRIASFGAFLELEPGMEGLVHISQISRERLAKTEDGVKLGEIVKVKVLAIDQEAKRISLSIKEALPPLETTENLPENLIEEEPATDIADIIN